MSWDFATSAWGSAPWSRWRPCAGSSGFEQLARLIRHRLAIRSATTGHVLLAHISAVQSLPRVVNKG
eukprot:11185363-Alexandrium_andersonii.AAC.1